MGDTMVPDSPFVTDKKRWRVTGALLALALLSGGGIHPVSPLVAYALLSNIHSHSDPTISMDLSLSFIRELCSSEADILLPWMIIPPGQDWKGLPAGHRHSLLQVLTNLDINVS